MADPGGWWSTLRARARSRQYRQIPPTDRVVLDIRRHPVVLVLPSFRTAAAVLAVTGGPSSGSAAVWFGLSCLLYLRQRFRLGWRPAALSTAVIAVVLAVAANVHRGPGLRWLVALAVIGWLADDLADWYLDRLVVTTKRIYRLYGVLTTHGPSISLTAVTFIDPLEGPVGRLLGYGTILFDTAAQEDKPLSRFDFLPDAVDLHIEILRLRSAAMPKFPTMGI